MIVTITHPAPLAALGQIGKTLQVPWVDQAQARIDEWSSCAANKCASPRALRDTITIRDSAIGTPIMAGGTKPRNAGTTAMTILQGAPAGAEQTGRTLQALEVALGHRLIATGVADSRKCNIFIHAII